MKDLPVEEKKGASGARPGPRWWPLGLIVVSMVACWIYVGYFKDIQRQFKVMLGAGVMLIGIVLSLIWLLTISRLRWRTRLLTLAGAIGGVLLTVAVFRYEGVTGDLIPILEPRWRPRAQAPATPGEVSRQGEASARSLSKGEFPQFLGPGRDGVIPGVRLASDWEKNPPRLLWRQPVGAGFGGFAIQGERAVTQEQVGDQESVTCYDLTSGRRLWAEGIPARYDNPIGGIGPRATPTISGGRVFTMGATGWLRCMELESGRVLWSTNVVGPISDTDLEWGVSSSPLVISNLVVVSPRGQLGCSLAAFHVETGSLMWTGGVARPHYSSPRVEKVHGEAQILTFTETAVAAHDPSTGALLWEHGWRQGHPHVADPRMIGTNRVLISSGYGTGSQLVEVTRNGDGTWAATQVVWRSMRLKAKFANFVRLGDEVYGLDDGRLACVGLADGTRRWEGERYGHGQLLLVGAYLVLTSESGDVVLVDADPGGYRERARVRAVEGKTWNPPALAGDVLLVRNDREAAAYQLPLEP